MRNSFFLLALAILCLTACTKSNGDTDNSNNNNNGGNTTPGPLFTSVKEVLQANCAVTGCHAGPTPQNGLNFTNNATIIAQKDRIKFRAVDEAGTPNQMPQPPRAPLSAADQKKITDWVTAGGALTN